MHDPCQSKEIVEKNCVCVCVFARFEFFDHKFTYKFI